MKEHAGFWRISLDRDEMPSDRSIKGIVYLIGAGPGDPGLITVRGRECLQRADVVVYDYLVHESLLSLARRDAELIYVGKKSGRHTMSQGAINKLLIERAGKGLRIARLKGGDPFIFGRGGEEAMELADAGIPFEIIPGVTSAIAVPAYAGIPLTHRNLSSTTCLVTGHEDPTKKASNIDWDSLAQSSGTLVFLMGMGNLGKITKRLIQGGRPPHTPTAVIGSGTSPRQVTVIGTLATIGKKAKDAGLDPPGVIVIGDVVGLREHLNWFESRPLFGKRILVTRPEEQAADFVKTLTGLGARCEVFPTIQIVPPESWEDLDRAIEDLSGYDWILFTSVNGVKYFFERLSHAGKDARSLGRIRIGVIGPKTQEALREKGISPDLIPDTYWTEGLAGKLKGFPMREKRILIPRPKIARDDLPKGLRGLGAIVDEVEAYLTLAPKYSRDRPQGILKGGKIDLIIFTSPSTVDNFVRISKGNDFYDVISGIAVACIGPVTAKKAMEEGLNVVIVPDEYTVDSLVGAIIGYYKSH
jgi:uroporphyrinogen III methyltransferase/synthase